DPRQAVHNEEHGGIVIWVGPDVSSGVRKEITDFYDESPNAILVTPIEDTSKGTVYPKHAKPASKGFLTSWTVNIKDGSVAAGQRFSERASTASRAESRGKGPERSRVSTLTPGT